MASRSLPNSLHKSSNVSLLDGGPVIRWPKFLNLLGGECEVAYGESRLALCLLAKFAKVVSGRANFVGEAN